MSSSARVLARENPFAVSRLHALRFRGPRIEDLVLRFDQLGGRAALVGPHGSGKTTLALELVRALEERGRTVHSLRITESAPELPPLPERIEAHHVVCLDGAGHVGWFAWRRFLRSVGDADVLVTQHAPGRLPTLHRHETSSELLEELVRELDPANTIDSHELFERHRGNVRDALFELYDRATR